MEITKNKKVFVLAKLTMTKADGRKIIVEVHEGASFHEFYKWFVQVGRKRKVYLRSSHRGDGILPYYRQAREMPGLDVLAARQKKCFTDITNVKILIVRKRAYTALLTCRADELAGGMPKANPVRPSRPIWERPIAVRFPVEYTPLQKRSDILTGKTR